MESSPLSLVAGASGAWSAADFQRYRVFEADVIDLFTGLEHALASPTGDTAAEPPTRRVPRRR